MKISKERLKEIIKEEIENQKLGQGSVSRQDVSKDLKQRSKEVSKQLGVDNKERAIIQQIEKNLQKLADLTNLKSGTVFATLSRLNKQIEAQIQKLETKKK